MNINLINPQYRFSFYNNLFSVNSPDGEMDMNQLIETVQYGYIREAIESLRNSSGEIYKTKKLQLPAVTLSGTFTKRNAESIVKHSGLIQVDIDFVPDYEALFKTICNDAYTYVCFRSPGGKGMKVIVKINPSVTTHLWQFYALEKYYRASFEIKIDPSCKDIARCMLLSYDPELFCNPFATLYEAQFNPVAEKRATDSNMIPYKASPANNKKTVESIIEIVQEQNIDITGNYDTWIKIGFALCTAFGEDGREYFHQLSSNYPNYTREETDKRYSKLLRSNNGMTHFGTIVFIAREHGIDV